MRMYILSYEQLLMIQTDFKDLWAYFIEKSDLNEYQLGLKQDEQ